MPLPPAQAAAARRYLLDFPAKVRKEGDSLFNAGRVRLHEDDDDELFFGTVTNPHGTQFEVSLAYDCGEWIGDCTCATEVDCKHCYATARALLAEAPAPVKAPKTKPAAKPAAQPAAAPKAPAGEEQFALEITSKLGRELNGSERSYLAKIFQLWTTHRDSKQIIESALTGLLSAPITWGYAMHQLWDRPPSTAWEAWLYLAAFLKRQKQSIPPFLIQVTPPEEIEQLVAAWQRRIAADQWRDTIRQFVDRAPETSRSVELRVVFDEKALLLESRDTALGAKPFAPLKPTPFGQLERDISGRRAHLDPASRALWEILRTHAQRDAKVPYDYAQEPVRALLSHPLLKERVVNAARMPFHRPGEHLAWQVREPESDEGDYVFHLRVANGAAPGPALIRVAGRPGYYVTADTIYETPPLHAFGGADTAKIPAAVLASPDGIRFLTLLGAELPPRIAAKTDDVKARVVLECALGPASRADSEAIHVRVFADLGPDEPQESYEPMQWVRARAQEDPPASAETPPRIRRIHRDALVFTADVLEGLRLAWNPYLRKWERVIGKKFPAEFVEWISHLPPDFELRLDPLLATLRDDPVAATVRLDVSEAAVDWFDLQVSLDVADTELTKEELDLLLAADGQFVRLGPKGWRRIAFQLSPEEEEALAAAGLDARDFSGEKHRLHALQLAGKSTERLLPAPQAAAIRQRVEEIQTRVAPAIPPELHADLRPYQVEGYHFLAYLSTNRFGGILADDMGLGKTLQTLAWLTWLRAQPDTEQLPSLVVCPKSVVLNWQSEAQRFLPDLRVAVLSKGARDAEALARARAEAGLVVINYAQLRLLETELLAAPWLVAVLDEAQFIKNPDAQTTRVAVQLQARHRLALSGTPIENRLLDLWSIMSFAMPGALGSRARFQKSFDQRKDPYARSRLAARARPFVLRRTKKEVAKDLPERIEEDLLCEMEGTQATLYTAELKRARQMLLKIKTAKELDRSRFNILTSLLRLRQICCHPALVSEKAAGEESAKLTALIDLLEPLMEEGHKVLVFSQFTGMLDLIGQAIRQREWRSFLLTGSTEDRQPLVDEFQSAAGSAVFLISLRAGGFGLNLTAASYVVLFDPWWNPAVENQAIDRTHRIGQVNQVNAYRLVVKNSIEEKIRQLQKQKRALAADVLGEETFTRALSLDDFKFLLEGGER